MLAMALRGHCLDSTDAGHTVRQPGSWASAGYAQKTDLLSLSSQALVPTGHVHQSCRAMTGVCPEAELRHGHA